MERIGGTYVNMERCHAGLVYELNAYDLVGVVLWCCVVWCDMVWYGVVCTPHVV